MQQSCRRDVAKGNTRIDKGEERQYQIIDPRMETLGNGLQWAHGIVRTNMDIVQDLNLTGGQHRGTISRFALRMVQQLEVAGHVILKAFELYLRAGGHGECHQHAGNRRMNARLHEEHPDAKAQHIVEKAVIYPQFSAHIECGQEGK